ncbi:contact-dependent growth inhibition system immunity protein [Streptomyces sp. NPDC050803]|uniref:contact-dependent growth inhibition system immunity protein n=1 Tax=unclassified Streptomyces TaxID=2593676 RepID=UPI00343881DD
MRRERPDVDSRSLEQLEGQRWPDPPDDTTHMVKNVHALRRRPIGTLEPHELARLIAQDVGLPHLLPAAVAHLRDTAPRQAAGGWYDDDLLHAVLTRRPEAWADAPDAARTFEETVSMLVGLSPELQRLADAFLSSRTEERPQ